MQQPTDLSPYEFDKMFICIKNEQQLMSSDDKPKNNRFRKLVPEPQADTNNSNHPPVSETMQRQIQIRQNNPKYERADNFTFSKNEDVAQFHQLIESKSKRNKRVRAQIKLTTTITPIEDSQPKQSTKHCSSLADYNYERVKSRNIQTSKDQQRPQQTINSKLLQLIEQFKSKTENIIKIQSLKEMKEADKDYVDYAETEQIEQAEDIEEKLQNLIQSTKLSSAKLIYIYLSRHITLQRKIYLNNIKERIEQANQPSYHEQVQITLKTKPAAVRPIIANRRQKLLNVDKFFQSK